MNSIRSKLRLLPLLALALTTCLSPTAPVQAQSSAQGSAAVKKKKKTVKKPAAKTVTTRRVVSSRPAAVSAKPAKRTNTKPKAKVTVRKTAAPKKPATARKPVKPIVKKRVPVKKVTTAKKPATQKVAAGTTKKPVVKAPVARTPRTTVTAGKARTVPAAPKATQKTAKPPVTVNRPAPTRITQPAPKPKATPRPAPPAPRATPRPTPLPPAPTPTPVPTPAAPPLTATPPTAQAYVNVRPRIETSYGQTMVPVSFIADGIGASIGPVATGADNKDTLWRISYFDRVADLYPYQTGAIFDGKPVTLPTAPIHVNGVFYVPWQPIADFLGIKWSIARNPDETVISADSSIMLVQFPAAYIEDVKHSSSADKTRVVVQLSNATRIVAARKGQDVQFFLSAARQSNVPTVHPIRDYLVPRAVIRSGDWSANVTIRINYAAPVRWFTLGSPPRLVIDLQKVFEERTADNMDSGLSVTKIRKGLNRGPVQMFLTRIDPREGWRVRVAPAGYSTLQRNRTSVIAKRNKALIAVNGGFFAYDGAAVGTLLVNSEWIRLPWKGRTSIGFKPDGSARIDNLQVAASAIFGSGLRIAINDLNGWPDRNRVTALTSRFRSTYKLRSGEIALVVQKDKVVAKPANGTIDVPSDGFLLIANGGAVPWLNKVNRGESARINYYVPGWDGITSALGAGPRLVRDGKVDVTATRENFREDVRIGTGPRTAIGIDKDGKLIILVVDGRKPYYSTGLTLTELAYTMIGLGAVDAMNLDGGGSTAMAVRGKLVNRPSDGFERSVANALIVTR